MSISLKFARLGPYLLITGLGRKELGLREPVNWGRGEPPASMDLFKYFNKGYQSQPYFKVKERGQDNLWRIYAPLNPCIHLATKCETATMCQHYVGWTEMKKPQLTPEETHWFWGGSSVQGERIRTGPGSWKMRLLDLPGPSWRSAWNAHEWSTAPPDNSPTKA